MLFGLVSVGGYSTRCTVSFHWMLIGCDKFCLMSWIICNRPFARMRPHGVKSHIHSGTSKTKELVPVHLDLPLEVLRPIVCDWGLFKFLNRLQPRSKHYLQLGISKVYDQSWNLLCSLGCVKGHLRFLAPGKFDNGSIMSNTRHGPSWRYPNAQKRIKHTPLRVVFLTKFEVFE